MKSILSSNHVSGLLIYTISIITSLILLINLSFKIIIFQGWIFSINSLICPLIAVLYFFVLKHYSVTAQRHTLNSALICLYLFCIGVYILVNLPASEYMHGNLVYQIVFEDIPKKFFATTLSFVLAFYLPHFLWCSKSTRTQCGSQGSLQHMIFLTLISGLGFFCLDFYLLFSSIDNYHFQQIFKDSLLISIGILSVFVMGYTLWVRINPLQQNSFNTEEVRQCSFIYNHLVYIAATILLVCLACEYQIIAIGEQGMLSASCLFFPVTMLISTVISECWGYRCGIKLIVLLVIVQLVFDGLLMAIVAWPSPDYFNLNPFYNYIMPRRLLAASFSLVACLLCNTLVLHFLNYSQLHLTRAYRVLVAGFFAHSLLCLIDYSMLFVGIYPYEQIVHLALNVWHYKLITTIIALPLILKVCMALEKKDFVYV